MLCIVLDDVYAYIYTYREGKQTDTDSNMRSYPGIVIEVRAVS